MKNIEKIAKNYQNVDDVNKNIRNIQSKKSRLKKQKIRKDYNDQMTKLLKQEQLLKEVRDYFQPKEIFVTEYSEDYIKNLDYDQVNRALKSIQSKKSNTRYLTDESEYLNAVKIETWLKNHKKSIKPLETNQVYKTDVEKIINEVENLKDISKDKVLEYLKDLIKE